MEEPLTMEEGEWESSVVDEILAEAEQLRVAISGDLGLSPVAKATSKPKPKPKRSRNSTRDRRQTEAQFLRRHIAELDDELARLKQRENTAVVVRPKGIVSAWQRLAQRQQIASARSERENASLRHQVIQRAQQIRSIQELLYGGRATNSLGIPRVLLSSGWDDATMFAELKRQAVIASSRTDRILEERGVALDKADGNYVSRDFDAVRCQLVAHLASTFIFPFDIHTTSTALWDALPSLYSTPYSLQKEEDHQASHGNQDQGVRVEERSDSVYAISYMAQLSVNGMPVSVRVRDVITRFDTTGTTNKTVIVWQTALDTNSFTELHASPVISSGWLVMQQQPGECRSTVLQSVFEFRSPSTAPYHPDKERNAVMETWIKLGETCVDNIVQQVDRKLLI